MQTDIPCMVGSNREWTRNTWPCVLGPLTIHSQANLHRPQADHTLNGIQPPNTHLTSSCQLHACFQQCILAKQKGPDPPQSPCDAYDPLHIHSTLVPPKWRVEGCNGWMLQRMRQGQGKALLTSHQRSWLQYSSRITIVIREG